MKKIFIIMLLFGLFLTAAFSQNEAKDAQLGYNYTYTIYTGVASDTLGSSDSTWTYTVEKLTDTKIFAYAYLDLDSIDGTAAPVTILLQNKVFDAQTFTTINTVTWTSGADTTFVTETSTADIADQWRVKITGSTDSFTAKVNKLYLKFIKQ